MLTRTKTLYEVLAWTDANNPQRPDRRTTWTRKTDALQIARGLKDDYGLVEVNRLAVDAYDENNVQGADLVASWTNGRKTA